MNQRMLDIIKKRFLEEMLRRGFIVNTIGTIIYNGRRDFDLDGWDIQVPMAEPSVDRAQTIITECFVTIANSSFPAF
jgi:hypothetical protein